MLKWGLFTIGYDDDEEVEERVAYSRMRTGGADGGVECLSSVDVGVRRSKADSILEVGQR